jgi:hypothetical protein
LEETALRREGKGMSAPLQVHFDLEFFCNLFTSSSKKRHYNERLRGVRVV